jgi:hypothetical protein
LPKRTSVSARVLLALAVTALALSSKPVAVAGPHLYVVIADQLSVTDVIDTDLPNLRRLVEEGAIGLMNTATAGTTTPSNAAVTIGAGARSLGPVATNQAFDRDTRVILSGSDSQSAEAFAPASPHMEQLQLLDTAEQVYLRRTGKELTGQIANLGVTEIVSTNRSLTHAPVPGSLGSALSEAGIRVRYYGNADTYAPKRHMTAAFMDRWGVIAEGSVEVPPIQDTHSAYGIRSDFDYFARLIEQGEEGSELDDPGSVVVLEIGDLARLYDAHLSYSEMSVTRMRADILSRLDGLIGLILERARAGDQFMLLVPTPPRHDVAAGNSFAPLALWGQGIEAGAVLTSATTRRAGIVTNLDVAPTILAAFGVDPPDSLGGSVVRTVEARDSAGLIASVMERSIYTGIQRRTILHPIVTAYILVYIAALLYAGLRPGVAWIRQTLLLLLTVMASMPLALLLLPLLNLRGVASALCAATLLSLGIALFAFCTARNPIWPIAIVSLMTVITILADAYTGNYLIKNSVLGYDPMGGARFYGIGNEYMGVLVGATTVGTTALLDVFPGVLRWVRPSALILYVVVLVTIALPMVGANVGGAITASISLPITVLLVYRVRLSKRRIALTLALPVAVVGLCVFLDLYANPKGPSHLGRAVQLIDTNGLSEALAIIRRKLAMNLKLFRYSVWSRAFVAGLAAIAWLLYRPTPLIRRIKERFAGTVCGLAGTTVGALTAVLVNDSGVVAGALVLHFAASAILYLSVYLADDRTEVSDHPTGT